MTEPGIIERLHHALEQQPADALVTPAADRVGGVLVLFEPTGEDDATLVYTRRRDELRSHPGQISFPGGRVDPGETVEDTALREAHEEVALNPSAVEVMGRLPAFFIPPSRFWLQPVVAHWLRPHPLTPAEAEVAAVLHVPLSRLLDEESWRTVGLSSVGWSWAWDLGDGHLLWGATALVTAFLLGMLEPEWSSGAEPADYRHREVRPWERERRVVDRQLPARLTGIEDRRADDWAADPAVPADLQPDRVEIAGHAVAAAVRGLDAAGGPVVVLAGSGGTGAVGRAAAAALQAAGLDVIVLDRRTFRGAVPQRPAAIVDALVGTGLRRPLAGDVLGIVHALRLRAAPVVSVDLPSGLHPQRGMIGEAVPADITVALGGVQPGLLLAGLLPFVGDLYVAPLRPDAPQLIRVVGATSVPTWRE